MVLSLDKLKVLLGSETSDRDAVLEFVLADVEETICNYCNVPELPAGLLNTAYRMAVDIARAEGFGSAEGGGFVTSIKEGDASVNYGTDAVFASSLLKNYAAQLNRYRMLGAPCSAK